MARRSLRPHLNQIRTWVRQGRTDAWIAHQLEMTVQQNEAFKRENELSPEGDGNGAAVGADFDDEIDLRAEDDALIAAEREAEPARRAEEDEESDEDEGDADEDDDEDRPKRRRGRRGGGGAARRRAAGARGAALGAGAAGARPGRRGRSRARSTTARRATGCGSTRPSRMIRCTPSTGPASARSR